MSKLKTFQSPAFCLLSAILLCLAFPKTSVWFFAWFGLIPLLFVLDGKSFKSAFGWGWACGFVFYGILLYWLGFVTVAGTFFMVAYLAVYFGLFAVGYVAWKNKPPLTRLFGLAALWVALDFIRAHFLTGFGWGALGESQAGNLFMIQIADMTGVNGVTFGVVLVNLWGKEQIGEALSVRKIEIKQFLNRATYAVLIIVALMFVYSVGRLAEDYRAEKTGYTVGVVQGNIEQRLKWSPPMFESILYRYTSLTTELLNEAKPELLIWPETAYPGFIWETPKWFEELRKSSARHMVPLLLGAVTKEGGNYHNSAIYIRDEVYQQHPLMQYHKLHLVPFGEFIPLRKIFPFLEAIAPIDDFTAGKEYVLFPVLRRKDPILYEAPKDYFAVLICFEDTMAYLARGFAQKGAGFFVNITNDAWFMDTRAPFMHLQNAVFRSIENRRAMVRAANTGVSAFIAPSGRVTSAVEKENRKTYIEGYKIANVAIRRQLTFYTKFGDIFSYLCFGVILWVMLPVNFFNKKLLL